MKHILLFVTLTLFVFVSTEARPESWKVTSKQGHVTVVSEFYTSKKGTKGMLDCSVNDANTEIETSKVKSILINEAEGGYVKGEITLKSGVKGKIAFYGNSSMKLISDFGYSEMYFANLKSLELLGSATTISTKQSVDVQYDSINMKNGDILSGDILTKVFKLKTSYAEMNIGFGDIDTIDLEGGGQNIDIVQLRSGDKISGIIMNSAIQIKMPIGSELTLEKEKVKNITMRKNIQK